MSDGGANDPAGADPRGPWLGERQRQAIAVALTTLAVVIIVVAVGALLWLAGAFLRRFSNVLLPVAVGAVAAMVFHPYFHWLRRRRAPKFLALVVVCLSILIPLAAFLWFFGAMLVDQISGFAQQLPAMQQRTTEMVEEHWPQITTFFQENPWGVRIRRALEGQQAALLDSLTTVGGGALTVGQKVLHFFTSAAGWAVMPIYFGFFLMAEPKRFLNVEEFLPFLKAETRSDVGFLTREFINAIVAFFRGQLIVAFLQGLLYAIGFSLVGLRYGFVLGIALGFLNIIPYLGSIVGLGAAVPLALLQPGGGWQLLVWVLVVFVVVQAIEGNLLTPRIMGDRTGLHPVVIIFAIFFWGTALGGILGMILAIPLTAFLVVFWRLARERYIAELI